MHSDLKVLLFDLDGVLIDSSWIHRDAFLQTFNEFQLSVDFDYQVFAGMKTHEVVLEVTKFHELSKDEIDAIVQRKQEVSKTLLAINLNKLLMPGVREYLPRLGESFQMVLCTSASSNTVNSFFLTGISRDLFEFVITGQEVANSKPSPEIYQNAMIRAGVLPNQCLVVEDSLAGVTSGLSSGAHVAQIGSLDVYKRFISRENQSFLHFDNFLDLAHNLLKN